MRLISLLAEFDDFVFASTHLSLTEADRIASIGIIEEAAKKSGKPFVVAGDLNDKPDSPFIRQFEEKFQICSGKQKSWPADKQRSCLLTSRQRILSDAYWALAREYADAVFADF